MHSPNFPVFQAHSDFLLLRHLLLTVHTQDLIEQTINNLYENYRLDKLVMMTGGRMGLVIGSNKNPLAAIEDEEKEHLIKMEKLEKEMEEVFNKKVEEKLINLDTVKQSENDDIERKQHFVDLEKAELFSMRAQFEREKLTWETKSQSQSSKSTSLGRKKHFRFSVGTLKFGKQ